MGCLSSQEKGAAAGGGGKGKGGNKADGWLKSDYELGKTLGKGGSCRVVEATKKHGRDKGEKYALKIMAKKEKLNEDLFKKEEMILKKLKHNNIIRLHEAREDATSFYLLTNLCTGGELFDRIVDKNNPITERRASELVATMLSAIEYCHNINIVHRDLKPENFVFKDPSLTSEMVLIDFGCAKIVEDEQVYKDLVGTPYYLAPESAAGHKYTRTGLVLKSSDIWSIGVIAFVLMTGRPPFNGRSNNEIFSAIIKKKVKFPPNIKLTKSFTGFVKKMLKKSPKQRMQMKDAIKHPWVTGKESTDEKISEDVIKVLRQFNQQSKLKKAITKTLAAHMGKEPEDKIRAHFSRLDADNNGELDKWELSTLLQDMGVTKAEAILEAERIIKTSDGDGNGTIGFAEFAQVWQRKLLSVNDSYIHAVFTVLDEDGSGQIDGTELAKVLDMNVNIGHEDAELRREAERNVKHIEDLITEVDKDGDGLISFKEFSDAMLETDLKDAQNNVGQALDKEELLANANGFEEGEVDLEGFDEQLDQPA